MSDVKDTTPEPSEGRAPDGITFSRRTFLTGVGAAAGLTAAGVIPAAITALAPVAGASEAGAGEDPLAHIIEEDNAIRYPGHTVSYADPPGNEKWAMVIDVKACVGCRRCVYACVKENNIGRNSGYTYIQVLEMDIGKIDLEHADANYTEGGRPDKWYMPVQCMQCAEAPCVYGCPVRATWRDPDGIVLIEYDKCIACRNCITTCPYGARHFNWYEPDVPEEERNPKVPVEGRGGVPDKCTFCWQRTRNGGTTACTEACPVGARKFGDLNDPNSEVSLIIKSRRAWRLKEEYGTEPMIWYVG